MYKADFGPKVQKHRFYAGAKKYGQEKRKKIINHNKAIHIHYRLKKITLRLW